MSANKKQNRPKARLAKGFRDVGPEEIRGVKRMLRTIEEVYESYGFEPLEQPFIEYTDALGKFLPDQDRPNEGVFSFQDDDEQWLSLRYDLTAPLARYVAENQQSLAMPHRSYRQGWVFRNEKPGPGRYRQFMQFDADTVGTSSPAADAEVCMMAADTLEALGIPRGQYVMKVNSRRILDGVLMAVGLGGAENAQKRLSTLRTIDKLDRLGVDGVTALLGKGRLDESGAYVKGVELPENTVQHIVGLFTSRSVPELKSRLDRITYETGGVPDPYGGLSHLPYDDALNEMIEQLEPLVRSAGFGQDRIKIDFSVVRGLEYYTGPVFEAELLIETKDEEGRPVRFGSVGGGGRYDDLVARFTGQSVPATGFSMGVSRLYSALKLVGRAEESTIEAPVVVLVLDRDRLTDYQRMTTTLRNAGIRAEMYLGTSGMKAQMKYADRRGAPLVIIQGADEKARGEVQIKDLRLGTELAKGIESREEYKEARLAQYSVKESELVAAVREALRRR